MTDKFHGEGGSYVVNANGERERVQHTEAHKDGDRPRNADGSAADSPATATTSALPKPDKTPPWATPAKQDGKPAKAGGKPEKA